MTSDQIDVSDLSAPRVVALAHPSLGRLVDTFCEALALQDDVDAEMIDGLLDRRTMRLGLVIGQRLASVVSVRADGRATFASLRRWQGTGVDHQLLTTAVHRFRSVCGLAAVFDDEHLDLRLVKLAIGNGAEVVQRRAITDLVPV